MIDRFDDSELDTGLGFSVVTPMRRFFSATLLPPSVSFLRVGFVVVVLLVISAWLPCSDAVAETASGKTASRKEILLPKFVGRTMEGTALDTASFSGKRYVMFLFNPAVGQAEVFAQAVANVAGDRGRYNFDLVGVAMGLDAQKGRDFAEKFGFDFPIFDDSNGKISTVFGIRAPLMLLGVDAAGYVGLTFGSRDSDGGRSVELVEQRIREYLHLPGAGTEASGGLDRRPTAPAFEGRGLGGADDFLLEDHKGKPLVLVFFLHTCPHCQEALRFFKSALAKIPQKQRPALIGISAENNSYEVGSTLEEEGLDFFPVLVDPERKIRNAYGVFAGTPDIFLLDQEHRIVHRAQGWNGDRAPTLARMVLAKISGISVPMLLNKSGFSGNDMCAVCHEEEAATWEFSSHAAAFDSLVPLGVERDAKCVGCHVVGFEQTGGYIVDEPADHLKNVGCEVCHTAGGPHREPRSKLPASGPESDYRSVCVTCHNPKHSLGFDYETFLPKVSHQAIAALSDSQREAMLTGRGKPRDLLPKTSSFVGAETCESCHTSEYAIWEKSAHADALDSLRKKRKDEDKECLRCHVTGFGRPGGFGEDSRASKQKDLARVGCESCHGPGAGHVAHRAALAQGKPSPGGDDIVSLGDKCDSCVILQICGSCHDDANDPGFRFKIEERIAAQRHGAQRPATKGP